METRFQDFKVRKLSQRVSRQAVKIGRRINDTALSAITLFCTPLGLGPAQMGDLRRGCRTFFGSRGRGPSAAIPCPCQASGRRTPAPWRFGRRAASQRDMITGMCRLHRLVGKALS